MIPKSRSIARHQHLSPYEVRMENAIFNPGDLYRLDGDVLLRSHNGCIETFDADLLER